MRTLKYAALNAKNPNQTDLYFEDEENPLKLIVDGKMEVASQDYVGIIVILEGRKMRLNIYWGTETSKAIKTLEAYGFTFKERTFPA